MSSRHLFPMQISFKDMEEILKAVFSTIPQSISCPTLVKVRSGDGIGFDVGDFVIVTNSKNNVSMLMKTNYDTPFEPYEELKVSDCPIMFEKDLIPGKTYMMYYGEGIRFIKYLGNHTAIMQNDNSLVTGEVPSHLPVPHYELFVSKSK